MIIEQSPDEIAAKLALMSDELGHSVLDIRERAIASLNFKLSNDLLTFKDVGSHSGVLTALLCPVLVIFYRGFLQLSKSLLDPFGNEDSKAQNIQTDTLLAESNAGSTRWARMAERMPFSFPSGSPDPWSQAGAA